MLRILLWKLGYEWANLVRILRPQDDQRIYYFAFGANLCPEILKQRRIATFDAFDYALEGSALRFSQSGFYKDHGFASADNTAGEKVYGRMYLIRKSDARRMDYFEGVPFLKAHEKVFQQHQGKAFYYYRAVTVTENLKPTQEYLDFITTAYRKMEIVPKAYVQAMEATEVLERLEPQNLTGKFIQHIENWPKVLQPLLVKYEAICHRTVETFWNSSLLDWMIKT